MILSTSSFDRDWWIGIQRVVSAASIIAKTNRDKAIRDIEKEIPGMIFRHELRPIVKEWYA